MPSLIFMPQSKYLKNIVKNKLNISSQNTINLPELEVLVAAIPSQLSTM